MVDEIMNVSRLEFVQDRHRNGPISQSGEEAYSPVRLILRTQSHLVANFEPAFIECDVKFGDTQRDFRIWQGRTLVIRKRRLVPVLLETLLQLFID